MWLFTKYGFFSVTKPKLGSGAIPAEALVQVRARVKAHLEALRARFPALGEPEILTTTDSDYRYRVIVEHDAWNRAASMLAEDIDYGNFKGACGRSGTWLNPEYVHALHEIWSIHHRLQRNGGDGARELPPPFEPGA